MLPAPRSLAPVVLPLAPLAAGGSPPRRAAETADLARRARARQGGRSHAAPAGKKPLAERRSILGHGRVAGQFEPAPLPGRTRDRADWPLHARRPAAAEPDAPSRPPRGLLHLRR